MFFTEKKVETKKSSFVSAGGYIRHVYNHCKKHPSLDPKTRGILLTEVTKYLDGFHAVVNEIQTRYQDEFSQLFKEDVNMANELIKMLKQQD